MLAVALLSVRVRVEERTRTLERRLVDQRLVVAVVFDTGVADDPAVERLASITAELRARQRFGRVRGVGRVSSPRSVSASWGVSRVYAPVA